jgi:hypothetical protein
VVETYVRAIEASELDKRLKAIEEATKCGPDSEFLKCAGHW